MRNPILLDIVTDTIEIREAIERERVFGSLTAMFFIAVMLIIIVVGCCLIKIAIAKNKEAEENSAVAGTTNAVENSVDTKENNDMPK